MRTVEKWRDSGFGFIASDLIAQIQQDARLQGRQDMAEDVADLLSEIDRLEKKLKYRAVALHVMARRAGLV